MSFADAGCVLKVDFRCDACKNKLVEVLSSVTGVYNVDMDGDLVRIAGEVDPNRLVKAVARTGAHAKIIKASFKHPNWDNGSTSLDYHQMPYPMTYGQQYHPAMHGGPGYSGMQGGPGFSGMHGMQYPFGSGPEYAEEYPSQYSTMHGGRGYPFQNPTMHGGHGYRRGHPAMGPGGPWYPPSQGFVGMNGFNYM